MKRPRGLAPSPGLLVLLALTVLDCSKSKSPLSAPNPPASPVCPAVQLAVTPSRVAAPEVAARSNSEVHLVALATDADGRLVEAEVVWQFQEEICGLAPSDPGRGHTLTPTGPSSAVFRAGGLAEGDYWIQARIPDCQDADGLPVQGLAKITVAPSAETPAQCGRIRVRYGGRDLANETVLGFVTLNLWAEVYAPAELRSELRVRFLLNGRPLSPLRRLYRPLEEEPVSGLPPHFRAHLPVFVKRGCFHAAFELWRSDQPVCASQPVVFATR